jgi:hypothetical protein
VERERLELDEPPLAPLALRRRVVEAEAPVFAARRDATLSS